MRSFAAKIQSSEIVLQIFAFHNQSWQLSIVIQVKDNVSDNWHPQQYLQLPFHPHPIININPDLLLSKQLKSRASNLAKITYLILCSSQPDSQEEIDKICQDNLDSLAFYSLIQDICISLCPLSESPWSEQSRWMGSLGGMAEERYNRSKGVSQ